jgi:hypothetical protein
MFGCNNNFPSADNEAQMQRHHRNITSRLLMVPSLTLILLSLLLVKPVLAATLMPIPAHSSTFTGNTRGYYFIAPSCFTITSLFVPTSASTADQHVQIVKFTAAPPIYSTTTNDFVSLGLWRNQPSTDVISTDIKIAAGDIIGILGSRGTDNSYGSGSYATTINGQPTTLYRMGMQFPLATTDARDLWSQSSSFISRVEMNAVARPMVASTHRRCACLRLRSRELPGLPATGAAHITGRGAAGASAHPPCPPSLTSCS